MTDEIFEVIWSYADDAYIMRKLMPYNMITPEFIGSAEDCKAWMLANVQPFILSH